VTQLRQRQPRVKDAAFLAFVRTNPCCACNRTPSQAAHIRMGSLAHDKRPTGKGERPSDRWSVPLCARCHLGEQHRMGERIFWEQCGIDPFTIAKKLFERFERDRKRK
jgi:hypothetical protein